MALKRNGSASRRPLLEVDEPPPPAWWDGRPVKAAEFIARSPVFRLEEFRALQADGSRSPRTVSTLLAYHVRTGRLRNLRRGLYATSGRVDPWVLGSRLTPDAVLSHDGALSFHGLTGLGYGMSYLTAQRSGHFHHNEVVYTPIRVHPFCHGAHIEERERAGQVVRVTSVARAVVDVLDRIELLVHPEAFVRTLLETRGLDFDTMLGHVKTLGRKITAGRLGLVLSPHRDAPRSVLFALEKLRPTSPAYFDRRAGAQGHRYNARWGLVVPDGLRALVVG